MIRFSRDFPCPVCIGHPDKPQGQQERCCGYQSEDGLYYHCTREELAGDIAPTNASPPTYGHKAQGKCKCGVEHQAAVDLPAPAANAKAAHPTERGAKFLAPVPETAPQPPWRTPGRRKPQATYAWRDAEGNLVFYTVRWEFDDQETGKRVKRVTPWTCYQWTEGGVNWEKYGPPRKFVRPLFNLPNIVARTDATVLVVEGEKAALIAGKHFPEYVVTTWHGGSKGPHLSDWKPLAGRHVIFWPDHDAPDAKTGQREGVVAMQKAALQARSAGAASLHIVTIPDDFPAKWDLGDIGDAQRTPEWLTVDRLRALLDATPTWEPTQLPEAEQEQLRHNVGAKGYKKKPKRDIDHRTAGQIARDELYGGHWISVDGELHEWTGTHYRASTRSNELRRIAELFDHWEVEDDDGNVKHPLAEASAVHAAYAWMVHLTGVSPDRINTGGINCTNGFLRITLADGQVSWNLEPHDPARHLVTYEPQVKFDPSADPTHCDRMLAALDPPERDIFLRTMAASLDLPAVRAVLGRGVRAVIALGVGNNGKDTLRETVSQLYGKQGVTSCSLGDFRLYDQGRKFGLASLRFGKVNWCSENAAVGKLESLKALMASITGDPIDIELKGKDPYQFTPQAVFVFNLNDAPNLTGALEAITSRYAILKFNKVFKLNPDLEQGELAADARMKYDPKFRAEHVLPALLNYMLAALVSLMAEGINYAAVEGNLTDLRRQKNHLYDFANQVGLAHRPGWKIYAGYLWEVLKNWYIRHGHVSVERLANGKEKLIWQDAAKGDQYVKAPNQVLGRFEELYPQTQRGADNQGHFLLHLALSEPIASPGEPVSKLVHATQSKVISLFPDAREPVNQSYTCNARAGDAPTSSGASAITPGHAHTHGMQPTGSLVHSNPQDPAGLKVSGDTDWFTTASPSEPTGSLPDTWYEEEL